MLYMKSSELKALGIDAAEVYFELSKEADLRELIGADWSYGCYAYSFRLDTVFFVEDVEPKYHSPIGSMLRVAPVSRLHYYEESKEESSVYDEDIPF